jgi:uncharacterized protein YndB with AHSA1/START domain
MMDRNRVELQAEVAASRAAVYQLLATAEGLAEWFDAVELEPRVGAPVRIRMLDAVATGTVLAVDPPQHISWSFDWESEPLGTPTAFALDVIDHGERSHVTLRHVGFRTPRQLEIHEAVWDHWFGRFRDAVRRLERERAATKR